MCEYVKPYHQICIKIDIMSRSVWSLYLIFLYSRFSIFWNIEIRDDVPNCILDLRCYDLRCLYYVSPDPSGGFVLHGRSRLLWATFSAEISSLHGHSPFYV